jgi:uncharacterized membrane protein
MILQETWGWRPRIMPNVSTFSPVPAPASALPPAIPRAVLRSQQAALACAGLLVLLGLAWELWLAPTGRGTLALKVLPLAAALPGLARRRLYTYRWTSLLLWLYFAEGVVRAASEAGLQAGLAAAQVALSLGLFVACVAHIRTRLRADAAPDAHG